MAVKLDLIGWQKHAAWFVVYIFDNGHPCYGQLTPVKTTYLLTSITWSFCEFKFRAHQVHMFFWSWTLVFNSITGANLVLRDWSGHVSLEQSRMPGRGPLFEDFGCFAFVKIKSKLQGVQLHCHLHAQCFTVAFTSPFRTGLIQISILRRSKLSVLMQFIVAEI